MHQKYCIVLTVIVAVLMGSSTQNVGPTSAAPTCAPGECSVSYFDTTLAVSPSKSCYNNGETVSLTCNGDLGGPPTNVCNGGTWVFPSSTCEVFTCPRPTLGDNLNVNPDSETYAAREELTYTCDQGYTLTGASSTTCDQQDLWNPDNVPVCIASCDVPVILNGNLTSSGPYSDGDTAFVQCYNGYNIESGSSTIISCNDGAWDEIPQCFSSCDVPAVPNSDITSDTIISHGTSLTIDCVNGYSYSLQTSITVTCDDGALSDTPPPSCYADCVPLSAPIYGVISSGSQHGQTVYYGCNRGFALNGTSSATCTDGVWTDTTTPICEGQPPEDSITLYCNPDKFIIEIPGELLGDNPGVDSILLGSCSGSYYDGEYLYANSSYNECGTTAEVDETGETVIYRNTLQSADIGVVTTEEHIEINTECVFDQNNLVSSSAVVQGVVNKALANSAQYDITFGAYYLADFTDEVTDEFLVETNSYIYILSEVNHVTMVDLFPKRCYATPQPEANYHLYYDLIDDGCPTSDYADEIRSDATIQPNLAFRIKVFRFTGSDSDSIYIHCELKVCPFGDCPLPSSCSSRRRRSSRITFTKHVSAGPITIRHDDTIGASASSWQLTALTVYSAVMSTLLISVVAIVGVFIFRKRSTKVVRGNTGSI